MAVNNCTFIGNLGKDPELRYTASGKAVCSFSIAVSEKRGDKDLTEWVNIVTWDKLAEICGKYLEKGKQVYISGRLQTRNYDDKDGNKRYITEIIAYQMQMLGGKGDAQNSQNKPQESIEQTAQRVMEEPVYNGDDEIPF